MKILIADDHTVVRHGLRNLLERELEHPEISEARNAREAVDQVTREEWDLILLDINMPPGRSGLDILEDAKRLRPGVPVLMLTGYPEEQFAVRAFKLGASGYINKQAAFDELLAAVKKLLAGGKYVTASLAEHLAGSLNESEAQLPHERLSSREMEVFRMIATGKTLKEIAAQLSLSEKTIGTYRSRISEKMALSTNVELARYALQHHLVE